MRRTWSTSAYTRCSTADRRAPASRAHNGNLVNGAELRRQLEATGSIFASMSDTEAVVHLIARSKEPTLEKALVETLEQCRGAYSIAVMTPRKIFVARDPYGFRPLVIGKIDDALVVSSETCAFDLIGAEMLREVRADEGIVLEQEERAAAPALGVG